MCLNKDDLLLQAIFGLLFQTIELGSDSAVSRDNARLNRIAIDMLAGTMGKQAAELENLIRSLSNDTGRSGASLRDQESRGKKNDASNPRSKDLQRQSFASLPSRLGSALKSTLNQENGSRGRSGASQLTSNSQPSLVNDNGETGVIHRQDVFARSDSELSPPMRKAEVPRKRQTRNGVPNLDYMAFSNGIFSSHIAIPEVIAGADEAASPADWEMLLSTLDSGRGNIYDGIYGGPQPPSLGDFSSLSSGSPDAMPNHASDQVFEKRGESRSSIGNVDGVNCRSWSPVNVWTLPANFTSQTATSQMSLGSDEGEEWNDTNGLGNNQDPTSDGTIIIPGDGSPLMMSASTVRGLYDHLDVGFGL
jgi:hypothetical protein